MSIFATLLTIFFLPTQFYVTGLFLKSPVQAPAAEKVEGASDHKVEKNNQSFKEAIADTKKNDTALKESGFIPQRAKDYRDTRVPASSSVVIDVDSGTIMHYDKGRAHMPIASLTKIMTAVLTMENVKNLDEVVTIDSEAISTNGTKVGCPTSTLCDSERLHDGEQITAGDLLKAMLLDSANDAAIALGKHIAGSQEAFADMMNKKAKELNLGDSHFCNPSGLDADGCYSSAYDLARIAAYSMKYDRIWKIMEMEETSVRSCDGKYEHMLKNTDMLLGQIPNILGGKTGFTYNAGKSLMLAAADPATEKHKIIAVLLNDNNRWDDMRSLIDWTFANYDWK
ncbi:MAG TPA: D-alanyl-D-alanine carboxypeptidase family protein [Candidatus Bathyarchaeia archaeon]|nr:D-alanyl-D-alanine carboxypeptidase family protein [Candidatus Bathyarchaeia archaeon]